jgi:hypothetical protein
MKLITLLRQALALSCLALLASCGGGGGGGDGVGSDGPFSVAYDRSSVELAYEVGDTVPQAVVQARAFGTPGGNVYVGANTPTGQPDPQVDHVQVDVTSTHDATVRIFPNPTLPPGTYRGTLLLLACSDNTCQRHYGGSPYSLGYTWVVRPGIRLAPSALQLQLTAGMTSSDTVGLMLPEGVSGYAVSSDDAGVTIDQQGATSFRVNSPAREPGTYTSKLTVTAGTYRRVLVVTTTVGPRTLQLDTRELRLSAVSGQAAGAHIAVRTLPAGASKLGLRLHFDSTAYQWMKLSNIGLDGFDLAVASLPAGTYRDIVVMETDGPSGATANVEVIYVVAPSPGGERPFSVTTTRLSFATTEGAQATQTLAMTPPSWNPDVGVEIAYAGNAGWLTTAVAADGSMLVTANAIGLAKGSYSATLTLRPGYPASAASLPVSLTVGPGLAVPAPQAIVIGSESTAALLVGSIPVVANGVTTGTWRATSSAPWLQLTRSSGELGTAAAYAIDSAQLDRLPASTDLKATVTITAQAAGAAAGVNLTPVSTTLSLRNELPEVHGVGPGIVLSGRAGTLIVRGRGFDHLADPAARLSIAGVAAGAVTRTSATALKVELPALPGGDHAVSVSNALGAPTAVGRLRVVEPRSHAAGNVATGGKPKAVLHDELNGQVFVSNPQLSQVQRFRETADGWVRDTLAIPKLANIGLSPDGAVLLVTETDGKVHLVDPATFTVGADYTAPSGFQLPNSTGHGIPFTNDSLAWLESAGGGFRRFDLRTRLFDLPRFDGVKNPVVPESGMEVSRNGERFMVDEATAARTIAWSDMSSGTWQLSPGGMGAMDSADNGIDETGNRLAVATVVYDASFAPIGGTDASTTAWDNGSLVLSPDGRRAYRLVTAKSSTSPFGGPVTVVETVINVFDASGPATSTTPVPRLPLLGSIELGGVPRCYTFLVFECQRPVSTISADGKTLFIASPQQLLVVPVPTALQPGIAAAAPRNGLATMKRMR